MARSEPPSTGSEKELLLAFLDYDRETVILKTEGLSDAQSKQHLVPSRTTLLGIVKHLILVERWWFRVNFLDEPIEILHLDPNDDDAEFLVDGDDAVALIAEYRASIAESNAIIAKADFDDLAQRARKNGERPNLRWIMIHMIEETARHAGQADIIRELIDGSTGN